MANPIRRTPENKEPRDREDKEQPHTGHNPGPEREKREKDDYSRYRYDHDKKHGGEHHEHDESQDQDYSERPEYDSEEEYPERPKRPHRPPEDDYPDPERPKRPAYPPSEEEYPERPKRPPYPSKDDYPDPPKRPPHRPPEDDYPEPPKRPPHRPPEEDYPERPKRPQYPPDEAYPDPERPKRPLYPPPDEEYPEPPKPPRRPPYPPESDYPEPGYPPGGEWRKPENPDDVISDIEKELARKTAESNRLKQENDLYTEHKTALKTKADEIDVIVQAYGQALTQMQEQFADRKLYSANKTPMLEGKVRDIKVKIHRIIREVDDAIYYLEQEVDGLKRAQDSAELEKTAASNDLTQKNTAFENLKKRKDDINGNLVTLNTLRTEIENDETGHKYPVMYFKIKGDYNLTLDTTAPLLVSTPKFEVLLNRVWHEIKDAMKRLRTATINLETAKLAYTEKNAVLTQRKGSRRQDIIKRLEELKTTPSY